MMMMMMMMMMMVMVMTMMMICFPKIGDTKRCDYRATDLDDTAKGSGESDEIQGEACAKKICDKSG